MTTAVVTGGTRGIGRCVAERLAELGHRTVALGRTPVDDLQTVEFLRCDVSDARMVEQVFAEIGVVDILVNNAGISSANPLARTTEEQWARNLAVNATGPFLCSRAVLPRMRDQDFGRIVTVASTASLEGAPYVAAYTASKHAVLGLMRVIAAEVADTGITANTVLPTYVRTDMTINTIENIAQKTGTDLATAEHRLTLTTPHGRILEISEVADVILDLINTSDNGREVLLDGADV